MCVCDSFHTSYQKINPKKTCLLEEKKMEALMNATQAFTKTTD